MLEFFRRNRGPFMWVVAGIVIVAFSFFGTPGSPDSTVGARATDTAFTIYGKDYTIAEMQRSSRMYQLASMLGLYQFASGLVMAAYDHQTRDSVPIDFALNLIVLERQMEELGIRPSDAEAKLALEALPTLQNEGKFDPARAAQVEENLGAYGFTSSDLLDLMKYDIGFRKLRELVTNNYEVSPTAAAKRYASMYQTIKASTVTFDLTSFEEGLEASEEEIAAYYEENKDTFLSEEKRSIQWVFFAEPADLDKIEDVGERNKKMADFAETVRAFAEKTLEPEAKLEPLAKEQKLEIQKAENFTQAAPPEALATSPQVAQAAFQLDLETTPISDPIQTDGGYYFAELVKVEEPKQQELAEVKEDIKATLIERQAREVMANTVNDAREKLEAGLKEGKKLDDLAKEGKWTVNELAEFSPQTPVPGLANAYEIAREAESTPAGEVSKPVQTPTGVLLVVVNERELRKLPEGDPTKENVSSALESNVRNQLFNAWFSNRKQEADLKLEWNFG